LFLTAFCCILSVAHKIFIQAKSISTKVVNLKHVVLLNTLFLCLTVFEIIKVYKAPELLLYAYISELVYCTMNTALLIRPEDYEICCVLVTKQPYFLPVIVGFCVY
jgi:hypothetical protein